MTSQIKTIIKKRKDDVMRNPETIYYKFLELVEQARNARTISDAVRKLHSGRVSRSGVINDVVNYSRVALENFAVLQLWKLFDRKNSEFHVWQVAEYLNNPALTEWLEANIKKIQKDIDLISEWRGDAIGHRGEAGYYAPDIREIKFTTARVSEKRLHDFLFEFLCQIRFETRQILVEHTMEELKFGLLGFESHIRNEMAKVFKDYDSKS